MAEILFSSPVTIGTCITERPPLPTCQRSSSPLPHTLGTFDNEHPPQCTWLRSSSPPSSPTWDMCH